MLTSVAQSGCLQTGYLLQAAEGQLDLVCRAQSIDKVLEDPDVSPGVHELLSDVPKIKAFAKTYGLVPTKSYESYVQLDRPVAVWVVSAAPKLSFESVTWSFPIVGSVPYLGWFDHLDAMDNAQSLADRGYDVDLRGASAYSTLGWFHDPVLSSMLGDGNGREGDLADTILHESLHATVYVKGQSAFNESLATFVGDHLAQLYLADRYGDGSRELQTFRLDAYESGRRQERLALAFRDLDALYKSKQTTDEKLAKKGTYLNELRAELRVKRPITNATLAGFRTYHAGSHAFEELFQACGADMHRFIEISKKIDDKDFDHKQERSFDKIARTLAKRGACGEMPALPPEPAKKPAKASDSNDDEE